MFSLDGGGATGEQKSSYSCLSLCGCRIRDEGVQTWATGPLPWKGFKPVVCDWIFGFSDYLVDPASSHMLVSKIKPCMSKYKQLYTVKLRTAHYISNNLFDGTLLHGYP